MANKKEDTKPVLIYIKGFPTKYINEHREFVNKALSLLDSMGVPLFQAENCVERVKKSRIRFESALSYVLFGRVNDSEEEPFRNTDIQMAIFYGYITKPGNYGDDNKPIIIKDIEEARRTIDDYLTTKWCLDSQKRFVKEYKDRKRGESRSSLGDMGDSVYTIREIRRDVREARKVIKQLKPVFEQQKNLVVPSLDGPDREYPLIPFEIWGYGFEILSPEDPNPTPRRITNLFSSGFNSLKEKPLSFVRKGLPALNAQIWKSQEALEQLAKEHDQIYVGLAQKMIEKGSRLKA